MLHLDSSSGITGLTCNVLQLEKSLVISYEGTMCLKRSLMMMVNQTQTETCSTFA